MRCISCTAEIAEESRSCPSCGARVEHSAEESAEAVDSLNAKTRKLPETSKPRPDADSARSGKTSTPSRESAIHTTSDSLDRARFVSGTIIGGQYRIVGLLGRGGMGEVYRAEDLKLEQPVALKFLPESLAKDGAALARFHREVRIAREISHRNVCRVYNIIEYQGWHFILMEYVRGEELSSVLKRFGRLPADKALSVARQLCAGLAGAPPEGPPKYMSPEKPAGAEMSPRSDIYSLGLVLYELFTGRKAFSAT